MKKVLLPALTVLPASAGLHGQNKKTALIVSGMGPGSFQKMKAAAPKSSAASRRVFRCSTPWTITRGIA